MDFCPKLKTLLMQRDDDPANVTKDVRLFSFTCIYVPHSPLQLKDGMRTTRSSDANTLKGIVGKLASSSQVPLPLNSDTKSDRGFNNNDLGRMLVPVEYLNAYNRDPTE
jgi:hypothetical protein